MTTEVSFKPGSNITSPKLTSKKDQNGVCDINWIRGNAHTKVGKLFKLL